MYKGDEVPPKSRKGLTSLEALKESAGVMGLLHCYLHPTVEVNIVNKDVYDSWAMLCTQYGGGKSSETWDIHEMYRVLVRSWYGEKAKEGMTRFITRWEMLLRQFEMATGMEFVDSVRSVMFADTLPSSWRSLVLGWRGARLFVPYSELVEKARAEDNRRRSKPHRERDKSRVRSPSRAPSGRTRPSNGSVECFYCFRSNHSFQQCRFLANDIEAGQTHNPHKQYACVETKDRTPQMVEALNAFVDERTTQTAMLLGDRSCRRDDNRRSESFYRSQSRRRSPSGGGRLAQSQNHSRDDQPSRSQSVYRGNPATRSRSSAREDSDFYFPPRKRQRSLFFKGGSP
ncbi:unnamed protein product [Phytophthora fragariaefolia]|uniref:Unnamed protein product n=1 Tax=Phytophthora fragariaefolia TaxID=1490495 RepID=A0A9W6XHX8_9STRA|nr:unnamed protein product [Phytophthora fragariaefolia]